MREARNLRNMTTAQTPLLGDANVRMLDGTGNDGAAPRASIQATPNPLLTPAQRAVRGFLPGQTPMIDRSGAMQTPRSEIAASEVGGIGQTPMRTPFRDSLGVNTEDGMSAVGETPRDLKRAKNQVKNQIRLGLASLPAPKNEFDIQVEQDPEEQAAAADDASAEALQGTLEVEDAAERDARIAALSEEERQKVLARRSQAVQKGLPRPANVDASAMRTMLAATPKAPGIEGEAQRLIEEEMVKLLHHDSVMHPVAGSKQAGAYKGRPVLAPIDDETLAGSRELVRTELATALGFPGANATTLARLTASLAEEGEGLAALDRALKEERESNVWHADIGMWVRRADVSAEDVVKGKAALLEKEKGRMAQLSATLAKEEKRLGKILGGYQARSGALQSTIKEKVASLTETTFTRNAFEHLNAGEESAIPERLSRAEEELRSLESMHNIAQGRFRELDDERRTLREEVESLQAQVDMRHAEQAVDAMANGTAV